MLRTALSLALLLTCLAPRSASAQEAELSAIRELIFQARFEDAIEQSQALLARTDLSAADRNAALEVLATAQIANRQERDATETLRRLYARDPDHRLTDPDASPPVISAFARARESQPTPIEVALSHRPPPPTRREPPTIEVQVGEGADAVAELRLVYRIAGEGESRAVMSRRPDGIYQARIPVVGDASSPTDVAYHVIALAPSQARIGGIGSAAEPLQVRIPAEAPGDARVVVQQSPTPGPVEPSGGGSVAEEWWFWTLLAVLVIGGGVTAGVLIGTSQSGPEPGTLGTVSLMQVEF